MSIALARPVLVFIVEGVTPFEAEGLPDEFKHDARSGGSKPIAGARRFFLEIGAARRYGPAQLRLGIASFDVDLVVEYPLLADRARLDGAIAADFEAITAALADQSQWQRTTGALSPSNIRAVGSDSGSDPNAPMFPREVEDVVVDGAVAGKRQRIKFQVEVTCV